MEWPLHCHVCGLSDVQGTSSVTGRMIVEIGQMSSTALKR
jgi:hypothetical protein